VSVCPSVCLSVTSQRPHEVRIDNQTTGPYRTLLPGRFLKTFVVLMLLHIAILCIYILFYAYRFFIYRYFITCLASCNYVAVCQPLLKSYLISSDLIDVQLAASMQDSRRFGTRLSELRDYRLTMT